VASATRFQGWLERLVDRHGSDLLLVAGAPPAVRVRGRVSPLPDEDVLDGAAIESAVLPALSRLAQQRYREQRIADASLQVSGLGRFRVNLHRERGRAAAAIRSLPSRPPRLADLNLPPSVEHLTRLPRGLVLIGGPTGAGKSTTLAAIVDEINRRDHRHIVAIEDPIEFEHLHHRSVVEQVEIGDDAPDFPTALRAALRQAPDVIVVGEMRDTETMQIAVAAAETGHLVLSTVHSPDVTSTIARVADSFPPERQNTIRQGLSVALAAVLTQMLLPRVGGGLVPAAELLMVCARTRSSICTRRSRSRAVTDRSRSRTAWRTSCGRGWSIATRRLSAHSIATNSTRRCGRERRCRTRSRCPQSRTPGGQAPRCHLGRSLVADVMPRGPSPAETPLTPAARRDPPRERRCEPSRCSRPAPRRPPSSP
jgi:twitching motility protein PilT